MKMSVGVIIESDFLWAQKMKKLLIQFNTFCYLRNSFDLKIHNLFETTGNT